LALCFFCFTVWPIKMFRLKFFGRDTDKTEGTPRSYHLWQGKWRKGNEPDPSSSFWSRNSSPYSHAVVCSDYVWTPPSRRAESLARTGAPGRRRWTSRRQRSTRTGDCTHRCRRAGRWHGLCECRRQTAHWTPDLKTVSLLLREWIAGDERVLGSCAFLSLRYRTFWITWFDLRSLDYSVSCYFLFFSDDVAVGLIHASVLCFFLGVM